MLQTADVDAKIMVEVSLLVCGLSSCFAAAEMASAVDAATDAAAMTVACGSSYFWYAAADAAMASAADVDANQLTML